MTDDEPEDRAPDWPPDDPTLCLLCHQPSAAPECSACRTLAAATRGIPTT